MAIYMYMLGTACELHEIVNVFFLLFKTDEE